MRDIGQKENRLSDQGADQLAELCAFELHKRYRLGFDAQPLQHRQCGNECRWRCNGQFQFQTDRNGIARSGTGEIGWQDQAKHKVKQMAIR